MYLRSSGNMTG